MGRPNWSMWIPPSELLKWRLAAKRADMTLSAWIRQAVNKALDVSYAKRYITPSAARNDAPAGGVEKRPTSSVTPPPAPSFDELMKEFE